MSAAESGPASTTISERVQRKFQESFGITAEQLDSITEDIEIGGVETKVHVFSELTEEKQLLLLKNLKHIAKEQISEEAEDYVSNVLSRSIKREKGAINKAKLAAAKLFKFTSVSVIEHEQYLAESVRSNGIKWLDDSIRALALGLREDDSLDIEVIDDEPVINFASRDGATPEELPVINKFNEAARALSNIPQEWRYSSASWAQRIEYKRTRSKYEKARKAFLNLEVKRKGDELEAALAINAIDVKVELQQLLTAHPEIEKQMANVRDKNVWARVAGGLGKKMLGNGEKGAAFALGTVTRTGLAMAGISAAVTYALPGLAAGLGAWRGVIRGKEKLSKESAESRRGRSKIESVEDSNEYQYAQMQVKNARRAKEEIIGFSSWSQDDWDNRITSNKGHIDLLNAAILNQDRILSSASSSEEEKARATQERTRLVDRKNQYSKNIERDTRRKSYTPEDWKREIDERRKEEQKAIDKRHLVRKEHSSKTLENFINAEDSVKRVNKLIQKLEEIEIVSEYDGSELDRRIRVEADDSGMSFEDIQKTIKEELMVRLKARVDYVASKLGAGKINFGEQEDGISNKLALMQAMSRAQAYLKVFEHDDLTAIQNRLNRVLKKRESEIRSNQRSYLAKQAGIGIVSAVGLFYVGQGFLYLRRELGWGHSNLVRRFMQKAFEPNYLNGPTEAEAILSDKLEQFPNQTRSVLAGELADQYAEHAKVQGEIGKSQNLGWVYDDGQSADEKHLLNEQKARVMSDYFRSQIEEPKVETPVPDSTGTGSNTPVNPTPSTTPPVLDSTPSPTQPPVPPVNADTSEVPPVRPVPPPPAPPAEPPVTPPAPATNPREVEITFERGDTVSERVYDLVGEQIGNHTVTREDVAELLETDVTIGGETKDLGDLDLIHAKDKLKIWFDADGNPHQTFTDVNPERAGFDLPKDPTPPQPDPSPAVTPASPLIESETPAPLSQIETEQITQGLDVHPEFQDIPKDILDGASPSTRQGLNTLKNILEEEPSEDNLDRYFVRLVQMTHPEEEYVITPELESLPEQAEMLQPGDVEGRFRFFAHAIDASKAALPDDASLTFLNDEYVTVDAFEGLVKYARLLAGEEFPSQLQDEYNQIMHEIGEFKEHLLDRRIEVLREDIDVDEEEVVEDTTSNLVGAIESAIRERQAEQPSAIADTTMAELEAARVRLHTIPRDTYSSAMTRMSDTMRQYATSLDVVTRAKGVAMSEFYMRLMEEFNANREGSVNVLVLERNALDKMATNLERYRTMLSTALTSGDNAPVLRELGAKNIDDARTIIDEMSSQYQIYRDLNQSGRRILE